MILINKLQFLQLEIRNMNTISTKLVELHTQVLKCAIDQM